MKLKSLFVFTSSCLLFTSTLTFADQTILTGNVKLACEAILCLSSVDKPNECRPSLNRYFNISKKKMSDTIKARKNFLNLCPSSEQKGMSSLIAAISQGAGRCDAAELNRVNRKLVKVDNPDYQKCISTKYLRCNHIAKTIKKYIVENKTPSYCASYFNHGWTNNRDSVKYVGDQYNGGKWINK